MVDEGAGLGGQQFLAGEVEGYCAEVSVPIWQQALQCTAFQMPLHVWYGDHRPSQTHQPPTAYPLGIVGHYSRLVFQRRFDAFAVTHSPDAHATDVSRAHGESIQHS